MSKRSSRRAAVDPAATPPTEEAPAETAPAAPEQPEAAADEASPAEGVAEPSAVATDPGDTEGNGDEGDVGSREEAEAAAAAKKRKAEKAVPPPPERLLGAVEAMLLASGDVLGPERLRDLLGLSSAIHVREALEQIRARWAAAGLSVELQDVARGVRVVTRPEYAEYVRRLQRQAADDPRLSQGLMETLSIVAYRQPVARAEIERIRGVQAGDGLRALLERHLIKVVGRSEQPGRPLLYGTTARFLTTFGLGDVKDLPSAKELARL
jgi:segregation and condensation protein B